MNLYGQDMDEAVTPLESGLGWTLAWEPADRQFVGRDALEAQRAAGGLRRFVGLLLTGPGVLRSHQRVLTDGMVAGEVTSGGFAPTLGRSIALARVDPAVGETCAVEIRGKAVPAKIVEPPFVRKGKACIELD
jgi:aminomethyltransferase